MLKDVVAEYASVYIPQQILNVTNSQPFFSSFPSTNNDPPGVLVDYPYGLPDSNGGMKKAFSLAHFIPLLKERVYVVSPFTRSYLVSWLTVLDSVPELELVSYLPEFLDGLL